MAQDYPARLDLLDFPPWQADDSGNGTEALGVASAKVWPLVLSVARRELADKVAVEERKALTLEAWEDTLLSVAETLKRHRGKEAIRSLEAFLVGTFQHGLSRAIVREKNLTDTIEFFPSSEELAELKHARDDYSPLIIK
jgi:hypothetical protein